jgi:SAM-dependent methyltransferase
VGKMQYNRQMDPVGNKTLEIMGEAKGYNNWLYGIIKKYINEPILEIGGGIGNFTRLLLKNGKVTSIDIDRSYIKKIKKIKNRDLSAGVGNIETRKYFFGTQKFKTLICMNVLEHIEDDEKALRNMYKLTLQQGKLILLVPSGKFAYGSLDKNLGHFRRYGKVELTKKLVGAGFKVESIRFLNFLGVWGWWFNGKLLRRKVLPSRQMGLFNIVALPLLYLEKLINLPMGLSLLVIAGKE